MMLGAPCISRQGANCRSDKPVFTVIFGGAAAFASAIGEAVKHL
jgi:hypothetical protein